MKALLLSLLIFSSMAFASNEEKLVFNEYVGDLKIESVDTYTTKFTGTVSVPGVIIFELRKGEADFKDIYKVAFVPDQVDVFPFVVSGPYRKKMGKIDFYDIPKAWRLVFSEQEWNAEVSDITDFQAYISRRGLIEVNEYTTTVECDSRQYYANFVSYKIENAEIAISDKSEVMAGC